MHSAENADDVKYPFDPTNYRQDLFAGVAQPLELLDWEIVSLNTILRNIII